MSTPTLDRLSRARSADFPVTLNRMPTKQDTTGSPSQLRDATAVSQEPVQQEPVQREAQWVDSVVVNSAMSGQSNFADSSAAYSGLPGSFSDPSPASQSARRTKT